MTLEVSTTKTMGYGTLVTIPVSRVLYSTNISVSVPFSRFIFTNGVSDITMNYSMVFRTTRMGSKVEVPLNIGIRVNGTLVKTERGQEPFHVDNQFSGLRGAISVIADFSVGDYVELVAINGATSCDIEFRSTIISLFDGAVSTASGGNSVKEFLVVGDGISVEFPFTHSFNNLQVSIEVYDTLTGVNVGVSKDRTSLDEISIGFGDAPVVGQDYDVIVTGTNKI